MPKFQTRGFLLAATLHPVLTQTTCLLDELFDDWPQLPPSSLNITFLLSTSDDNLPLAYGLTVRVNSLWFDGKGEQFMVRR